MQRKDHLFKVYLITAERTIPRTGSSFRRGEAMRIGKAYESTRIEVQECSANRPPAKESLKAVSKNKPKKVLMCNVPAK